MKDIANDLGMDPDEFDKLVGQIARQKKVVAEKQALLATEKKEEKRIKGLFKAAGGKIGILEDLLKEREDPDWHMNQMRDTVSYGRRLGIIPSAFQLDLFDVTDDPLIDKAYEAGLWAGMTGGVLEDSPHDVTTAAGQKWVEGFYKGSERFDQLIADANILAADEPGPLEEGDTDDDVSDDALLTPSPDEREALEADAADDPRLEGEPDLGPPEEESEPLGGGEGPESEEQQPFGAGA